MQFAQIQTENTNRVVGQVYIAQDEPSTPLGTLMVIVEASNAGVTQSEELDSLLDHVIDTYYAFEEKLLPNESPENVLEHVATNLNRSLAEFFPEVDANVLLSHLSIFIGAVQDTHLYFTRMGDMRVFLQHGTQLLHITEEQEDLEEGALFSYITAGQLKSRDSVLVTSPSLLDYFSETKITHILQDYDADEAIDELHTLVEEFSSNTLFQAIIFKNAAVGEITPVVEAPIKKKKKHVAAAPVVPDKSTHAKHSIDNLLSIERSTDELLSSSFWKSFKKSTSQLRGQLKGISKDPVTQTNDSKTAAELAIERRIRERSIWNKALMMGWTLLQGIFVVFTWGFAQLWMGGKHLFKRRGSVMRTAQSYSHHAVKAAKKLPEVTSDLPERIKKSVTHAIERYNGLHKRRQQLLWAGVALAVILIVSISFGVGSSIGGRSTEEISAVLDEVSTKQASAEAVLIYGNEVQASKLISEARAQLNDLGEVKDDALAVRKAAIANDLFEMYKRVQKLTELDNPEIVATLTADDVGTPLIMTGLAGEGDHFYGFDDQNNVYDFNLATDDINLAGTAPNTIVDLIPENDDSILVYLETPEAALARLNIAEKTLDQVTVTFNNALSRKAAILPYFSRLYVLDPRERQIFRHQLVGTTYTSGQPWVQDTTVDLSDATDMVIDGSIWVLKADGEIIKLAGGEREDFTFASIDPILNTPNFIWTHVDSNYLYILDPPTRRVVIAYKDGSIYQQFVSEKFNDMKSAVIDEPHKKIYVLNGHQIFEVPFE